MKKPDVEYRYNATVTIEFEIDCGDMTDAEIKVATIVEHGTEGLKDSSAANYMGAKIVNTETKYIETF